MSYRKRTVSTEVAKANKRLDGIRSIEPNIDLGNGITDAAYATEIAKVTSLTEKYNTLLSEVDGTLTALEQAERELADYSQRILNAVGTKFGYNSIEYEKAGGTRKSEKRRTSRNGNNGGENGNK
ncbi:MAG TPA: hypothetical protein VHO72_11540 [Bacteroidales bacterium]|nr:hypothetical protein [Bacteroidales bacterium]